MIINKILQLEVDEDGNGKLYSLHFDSHHHSAMINREQYLPLSQQQVKELLQETENG